MRSEVRRPQIAAAVLDVVAEDGPGGLTVAAVAARVGLVPSALYRHFSSKDDLLMAALDLVHERLQAEVAAARGRDGDPLQSLRALLTAHVRLIGRHGGVPRLVFSEAVFGTSPMLRERVRRIVESYLDQVAALIAAAQAAGQLAEDRDPRTMAGLLLGLVQSTAVLSRLSEGAFDVGGHLDEGWRLFTGLSV